MFSIKVVYNITCGNVNINIVETIVCYCKFSFFVTNKCLRFPNNFCFYLKKKNEKIKKNQIYLHEKSQRNVIQRKL